MLSLRLLYYRKQGFPFCKGHVWVWWEWEVGMGGVCWMLVQDLGRGAGPRVGTGT